MNEARSIVESLKRESELPNVFPIRLPNLTIQPF